MSDDDSRRTVEDHYDALHLMKEGLEDANALKVFLMAPSLPTSLRHRPPL